jgi:hypothetical protein
LQLNVTNLALQIDALQQNLKKHPETKQQLIAEMKQLSSQKNNNAINMNALYTAQNDCRVKLSRMGSDKALQMTPSGTKAFVDYMSDIASNNVNLQNKFDIKYI